MPYKPIVLTDRKPIELIIDQEQPKQLNQVFELTDR